MFPIEAFESTLKKATRIFEELSIRYHLTGGVTSIAYIEPRLTQDVDLVIDRDAAAQKIDSLMTALSQSDFFIEEQSVRSAIAERRMFQLIDLVEALKVDVYPRELIAGELDRSVPFELFDGVEVPISSRVDAIVSKVIWISKGSHKSRRDVKLIYRSCDPAEQAAVREHCEERELTALLDEVLAEPDEFE